MWLRNLLRAMLQPPSVPPMKYPERKFTIGRDKNCDVPIADDSVSRLHAELTLLDGGSLSLTDCHSSNGTAVIREGKPRPIQREIIFSTDQLQFGDVVISAKDLLDAIRRKYPDLSNQQFPGLGQPGEQGSKLIRCGCGAIKEKNQLCPACGE